MDLYIGTFILKISATFSSMDAVSVVQMILRCRRATSWVLNRNVIPAWGADVAHDKRLSISTNQQIYLD
jgi:hypothetical protein